MNISYLRCVYIIEIEIYRRIVLVLQQNFLSVKAIVLSLSKKKPEIHFPILILVLKYSYFIESSVYIYPYIHTSHGLQLPLHALSVLLRITFNLCKH